MKNKLSNLLLAFVIAFGLWLYVITVVSPGSEKAYYNVPVVLQNESVLAERGMMLVEVEDDTVTVNLAGNRSDLNNINASDLTLVADLSVISEPGVYELGYTVTPPGNVSSAVTTQSKEPDKVKVTVSNRLDANLPIHIRYTGSVPEGYMMDKSGAELDPLQVHVSGPEEVVSQIDHAAIEVDIDQKTESIAQSYKFVLEDAGDQPVDAKLVTVNVEEIRVQLRISRTKTVKLKLAVVDGGGATADTTNISIEPSEITVTGSEAALEGLDELVLGTINLAEIIEDTSREYDITLPEGVTNVSNIATAKASISFPQLEVKQIDITNIKAVNVPDGMQADLLTKVLTITVRGPAEQIQNLKASNITVKVDVAQVNGTETVVPTITFGEAFADVGAVGKYSVTVTVSEIPETTAPPSTEGE